MVEHHQNSLHGMTHYKLQDSQDVLPKIWSEIGASASISYWKHSLLMPELACKYENTKVEQHLSSSVM